MAEPLKNILPRSLFYEFSAAIKINFPAPEMLLWNYCKLP